MVEPEAPPPWLRTVALSVKGASGSGLGLLTEGCSTTRSGRFATVTSTALEQLLPVLDSPLTASTHAP